VIVDYLDDLKAYVFSYLSIYHFLDLSEISKFVENLLFNFVIKFQFSLILAIRRKFYPNLPDFAFNPQTFLIFMGCSFQFSRIVKRDSLSTIQINQSPASLSFSIGSIKSDQPYVVT
jgi:hypothetical protein